MFQQAWVEISTKHQQLLNANMSLWHSNENLHQQEYTSTNMHLAFLLDLGVLVWLITCLFHISVKVSSLTQIIHSVSVNELTLKNYGIWGFWRHQSVLPRAAFQYHIRRLMVKSRKAARFVFSPCQISRRRDDLNYQSCSYETSRDLMIRRLFGYWNRAQKSIGIIK